jgi:hypothetical protein
MISVIIPTMWKCESFRDGKMLYELSEHPLVGEIILIDNSEQTHLDIISPKVIHIKEEKNTYVNPAWNKGVKLAKYDKLLILNDDVETEWGVIDLVYDSIIEENGLIGAGVSCWQYSGGIPEIERTSFRTNCYGCLMFIHKNSYKEIPESLKVHYGDDWLFNKSGKPNYQIVNWKMGGESEQTSGLSEFNQIKENDKLIYNNLK